MILVDIDMATSRECNNITQIDWLCLVVCFNRQSSPLVLTVIIIIINLLYRGQSQLINCVNSKKGSFSRHG